MTGQPDWNEILPNTVTAPAPIGAISGTVGNGDGVGEPERSVALTGLGDGNNSEGVPGAIRVAVMPPVAGVKVGNGVGVYLVANPVSVCGRAARAGSPRQKNHHSEATTTATKASPAKINGNISLPIAELPRLRFW